MSDLGKIECGEESGPLPAKAVERIADPLGACRVLADGDLAARLGGLVRCEKRALALLIAHLAEFDRRKLYADLGHSSLYDYCTRALGYSEAEATWRIYTARAARRFPVILELLENGALHMTAVVTLSPHLTRENHQKLLKQAEHKSRRDVETLVAGLLPKEERADCVWYLSGPSESVPQGPAPSGRETIQPCAPCRVRIGFDADEPFLRKLERARQLLRHKFPAGKLADVFQETVEIFLDRKDPGRKLAAKEAKQGLRPIDEALAPIGGPEPSVEHRRIPQRVRDEVWRRDEGRCTFKGPDGERCKEQGGLELDHIVPWALGGPSNDPRNIRLLCRTHNQLFARRVFGNGDDT